MFVWGYFMRLNGFVVIEGVNIVKRMCVYKENMVGVFMLIRF